MSVRLEDIVNRLPLVLKSEHFVIRYGLRNPPVGRGLGSGGVRDETLVLCYRDALERLYSTMTTPPLSRQPPNVGGEGKTAVYVFDISEMFPDGSPFTSVDHRDIPYIALPCRSVEPTTQAELQSAAAAAVHEATHVFNFRQRGPRHIYFRPWRWFDEATALLMESVVLSDNPDGLRYVMNWCDRPEVSLDAPSAWYQTGMFARYLAERIGLEFISKVWMESEERETPLEALTRLMQEEGQVFSDPNPGVRDIFSSYCIDSYFLWDTTSDDFAPKVYARFGGRAVTESFELRAGEEATSDEYTLDHLACRYYRFYVRGGVKRLRVELRTTLHSATPLKAELAIVTTEMQRGQRQVLSRISSGPEDPISLGAQLELDSKTTDHIVLVVSNCGLRAVEYDTDTEHGNGHKYTIDGHKYTIHVSAQ